VALNNYANLKTAIANWLGRTDLDSPYSAIDDGLAIFESWVNRNIRHRRMITTATGLTIVSNELQHPTDFLEWFQLLNTTSPRLIEIVSNDAMTYQKEQTMTGNPRFATVNNTGTELYPVPADTTGMTTIYYAKLAGLSGSNTTNWLLTNYPDLYLAGCILSMAGYVRDSQQKAELQDMLANGLDELKKEGQRTQYGGSVLSMKATN